MSLRLMMDWDLPTKLLVEDDALAMLRGPSRQDGHLGPVLLLHGLGVATNTFEVNERGAEWATARLLHDAGFEVWLLDWRGSGNPALQDELRRMESPRGRFTLDAVADDIEAALSFLAAHYEARGARGTKVAVLAQCIGAAAMAMALASPRAKRVHADVDRVVLGTTSLFYALDPLRQAMIHERVVLRWICRRPEMQWLDPFSDPQRWPTEMAALFAQWRGAPITSRLALVPERDARRDERFGPLAFLYGEPFARPSLPKIRAQHLPDLFGRLNLDLFAHAIDNARHKFAAPWGDVERIRANPSCLREYYNPEPFKALRRLTLLTGARNRLWHRDSIDRMYDWLLNAGMERRRLSKVVMPNYWHQDLYWGQWASREVIEPYLVPALMG